MGHRVPNHKSKCYSIHGHNFRIEVGVSDKVINTTGVSDEGMVIDFSDLKEIIMQEIDRKFDHGFVVYNQDKLKEVFYDFSRDGQKIIFVDFIPTAENLAKYWYKLIELKLQEKSIKISHVKVWETSNNTATYNE